MNKQTNESIKIAFSKKKKKIDNNDILINKKMMV